jgi:hypothetical protein
MGAVDLAGTVGEGHGRGDERCRRDFRMPGIGSSRAFGDTTSGLTFGLTKNRLTADFSTVDRIAEIATSAIVKG